MNKPGRNDSCPCGSGHKFKRCHRGKIFAFRSENFTISAASSGKMYKLFKITFHQNAKSEKASIIISFPYHKNSNGLLSEVTFPKNKIRVSKISLIPGGVVTSNKVKYSHWADGSVHFSQDGKIHTFRKAPSNSLKKSIGHIFTIQVKGVKGFDEKTDAKKLTAKEIDLDFNIGDTETESIKFTGWWYDYDTLHPNDDKFNTCYSFTNARGISSRCFALQPLAPSVLSSKVLILSARSEFMTKERGTHLFFLGGFDMTEVAKDLSLDTHFLAMQYPARNYKKLREKLKSVDYEKNDIVPFSSD